MILSISILAAVLLIIGLSALFAIALGRAAARGDAELNDRLRRARDIRGLAIDDDHHAYYASRQSYAGLDRARVAYRAGAIDDRTASEQESRCSARTCQLAHDAPAAHAPVHTQWRRQVIATVAGSAGSVLRALADRTRAVPRSLRSLLPTRSGLGPTTTRSDTQEPVFCSIRAGSDPADSNPGSDADARSSYAARTF